MVVSLNRLPLISLSVIAVLSFASTAHAFGTTPTTRQGWRWYHNDSDLNPSPATAPFAMRWGTNGGEVLRLRHVGRAREGVILRSAEVSGNSCPAGFSAVPDSGGTGWVLSNGLGTRGARIEERLIAGDEQILRGYVYEGGPGAEPPMLDSFAMYEHDFAISLPRAHFAPNRRASFAAYSALPTNYHPGSDAPPLCHSPQVCTVAGPPTMTPPQAAIANLRLRSSFGIDVEDWNGDGLLDLLVGSGQTMVWHPGQAGGSYGLGSVMNAGGITAISDFGGTAPDAADWDADGDLDLVTGSIEGVLYIDRKYWHHDTPSIGGTCHSTPRG